MNDCISLDTTSWPGQKLYFFETLFYLAKINYIKELVTDIINNGTLFYMIKLLCALSIDF